MMLYDGIITSFDICFLTDIGHIDYIWDWYHLSSLMILLDDAMLMASWYWWLIAAAAIDYWWCRYYAFRAAAIIRCWWCRFYVFELRCQHYHATVDDDADAAADVMRHAARRAGCLSCHYAAMMLIFTICHAAELMLSCCAAPLMPRALCYHVYHCRAAMLRATFDADFVLPRRAPAMLDTRAKKMAGAFYYATQRRE